MRPNILVRRFDVHAESVAALERVGPALQGALDTLPDGAATFDTFETNVVEEARVVTVRLGGVAAAVDAVRNSVMRLPGVQVRRDFLDVPAGLPPETPAPLTTPSWVAAARPEDEAIYPDLRALLKIDPYGRSRFETGSGEPVVVAIVDSGIMVDHPALARHLWAKKGSAQPEVHGARFMDDVQDDDLTDQDGHGTMLAGSILATANSVAGLQLMAVKFFDVVTQPSAANAARAIRFAVENRASIINLSFDLGIGSSELRAAIQSAFDAGALVVMAAGNTGADNDRYPLVPACYAELCRKRAIVVMATDWSDERLTISNFGTTTVDLAAPGVRIVSTRTYLSTGEPQRKYGRYTGTSAAAAQVTGAAALLMSQDPSRKAEDLKDRLMASVDDLPWLKCKRHGRINLSKAL
jgi:subtilisin family serine protease